MVKQAIRKILYVFVFVALLAGAFVAPVYAEGEEGTYYLSYR